MGKGKLKKRSKRRNKLIFKSLLLVVFLFGLNTFAWFIYISKVSTDLTASVVSWDITFMDDNNIVEHAILAIPDMKPGMNEYSKEFRIINRSGVDATFKYDIVSMELFGDSYSLANEDYENEDLIALLEDGFPFKVSFLSSTETISQNTTSSFQIAVNWSYEPVDSYVKLNRFYEFDPNLTYYVQSQENTYSVVQVTSSNFENLVTTGLYLQGDVADTYWGEKSADFKALGGGDSLILNIELEVKQA